MNSEIHLVQFLLKIRVRIPFFFSERGAGRFDEILRQFYPPEIWIALCSGFGSCVAPVVEYLRQIYIEICVK